MGRSMGSAFTLNLIAVFIVLVFAFLAGTLSYTKAFKVNSRIVSALEKYEGYNYLSKREIDETLSTIGYIGGNSDGCSSSRNGGTLTKQASENFKYCIYFFDNDGSSKYYSYGVVTYMYIDLPVIGSSINIPIYAKTNRIYKMGN